MDKITVKYEIAFDVPLPEGHEARGLREADGMLRAMMADLPAGRYAKRLGYYEGPANTFHAEDRDALSL